MARLRKDRPDIHARVLAGELSPHAGMIEAEIKFRQEYDKIERAKGTQGQGRPKIGGIKSSPPISEPTIAEMGLDKNRLARAKKLKELSAAQREMGRKKLEAAASPPARRR
jgi:hypothetical protein